MQQAEPSVSTSSSVTLRTRAAYGLEMSKDGAMPRSRRFAAGMRIAVENFAHLLARERLQAALAERVVHSAPSSGARPSWARTRKSSPARRRRSAAP
ncbi:MAG: hypothetical protein IKO40_09355 [Kiritimatiellae bacterium]|nr:hypothetical protein [Kiritimatiellia bacterium]